MNREQKATLAVGLVIVVAGALRWISAARPGWTNRFVVRSTVYVTNWANPEDLRLPALYTNYYMLRSDGRCHWFLIVSNLSDDFEVHFAK